MTVYTCRICGFESGSPLGIVSHSKVHKNRFRSLVGREPDDYEEVVDLFRRQPTLFAPFEGAQTTLFERHADGGESER